MEFRIGIDKAQLKNLEVELAHLPGGARKALVTSLNRTIKGCRTDAAKAVSKTFFVTQADVKKTMRIRAANKNHLEASVISEAAVMPLSKFRVSPKGITNPRPRRGLVVKVRRSGGGRQKLQHGFWVRLGGHLGVFTRVGKNRHPIKQRYGPAIPSMIKDSGAFEIIQKGADERLRKNIDHEIERLLKGYGK